MLTAQSATFDAAISLVREYIARNPVSPEMLPTLISSVFSSVDRSARGALALTEAAVPPISAVPVSQSVTDEYLICLEDGSRHKMMKRYLARVYNVSPEAYRAKWGLPSDYPMTAPGYSEVKRIEAKKVGLGTKANKLGKRRGGMMACC